MCTESFFRQSNGRNQIFQSLVFQSGEIQALSDFTDHGGVALRICLGIIIQKSIVAFFQLFDGAASGKIMR
jgi:hypothetical protein